MATIDMWAVGQVSTDSSRFLRRLQDGTEVLPGHRIVFFELKVVTGVNVESKLPWGQMLSPLYRVSWITVEEEVG